MYTLIIVLLIIVAILICGIVLIQESKGGGLASGFSSANAALGVRKTTDFLEKTTWTLAAILIVLCVLSSKFAESAKKDTNINTKAPAAAPAPVQQNPLSVGGDQNQPANEVAPTNAEAAPANAEAAPANAEAAPAKTETAPAKTEDASPAPAQAPAEPSK